MSTIAADINHRIGDRFMTCGMGEGWMRALVAARFASPGEARIAKSIALPRIQARSTPPPRGPERPVGNPVRVGDAGNAVTLGAYSNTRRAVGAIAIERNRLQRVGHVLMQTEGRDIGSVAAELEHKLKADLEGTDKVEAVPLALAVVGGLTSSTLLSLFLVPVMFLFFAKRPAASAELAPSVAEAST